MFGLVPRCCPSDGHAGFWPGWLWVVPVAGNDGVRLPHDALVSTLARPGSTQGLPDSKLGTFTPALYDEAKKNGWTVISMKNNWRRIFAFE